MAGFIDDAAGAGRDIVITGIAGAVEDGVGIDEESDAGAQLERAGEKSGGGGIGFEFDGLAGGAMVERGLDAGGVGLGFVRGGESDRQTGGERGAGRRNDGFGNRAGVLGVGGKNGKSDCTAETQRRGENREKPSSWFSLALLRPRGE